MHFFDSTMLSFMSFMNIFSLDLGQEVFMRLPYWERLQGHYKN